MKLVIDQPEKRWPGMFEMFSITMLAAGAIMVPLSLYVDVPLPHSILRAFGGACPLCGGTRAVTSLFLGRIETAIRYNPLALIIFGLMLYSAISYVAMVLPFGRRPVLYTTPVEGFLLKTLIVLAFIANWAYVLWAHMYTVPLTV
jgi:hypothetical protein